MMTLISRQLFSTNSSIREICLNFLQALLLEFSEDTKSHQFALSNNLHNLVCIKMLDEDSQVRSSALCVFKVLALDQRNLSFLLLLQIDGKQGPQMVVDIVEKMTNDEFSDVRKESFQMLKEWVEKDAIIWKSVLMKEQFFVDRLKEALHLRVSEEADWEVKQSIISFLSALFKAKSPLFHAVEGHKFVQTFVSISLIFVLYLLDIYHLLLK